MGSADLVERLHRCPSVLAGLTGLADGVPGFSSPVIGGGGFWLYEFEEPGVYTWSVLPAKHWGWRCGSSSVTTPTPLSGVMRSCVTLFARGAVPAVSRAEPREEHHHGGPDSRTTV